MKSASAPLTKQATSGGLDVPESMIYSVYMVMLVDTMAGCISTPVMPYYAESFGVPDSYIGFLYSAFSFTATVFAPMLSGMADTWGRKSVLVACLVGAGTANVIQGLAVYCGSFGFWVFVFGRAFSGVWASVGATCNVYVTDVTAEGPLREKYLGQLAMVPTLAIMTGPGIGGGLAKAFGNNVPVTVDGVMTLISALIVHCHLVETPAFLKSKEKKLAAASNEPGNQKKQDAPSTPPSLHILGIVSLVSTLASQGNLAMYALFFKHAYKFDTLLVGFLFMGSAVMMLLTMMGIVPILRSRGLGPVRSSALGAFIGAIGCVSLGFSGLFSHLWFSICSMLFSSVGGSISMAQGGAVTAYFTTVENRGKVFALIQTYQNFGKILGPMLSTNVDSYGLVAFGIPAFNGLVFVINGGFQFISFVGLLSIRVPTKPGSKSALKRGQTKFGTEWEDEAGDQEDVIAMGKFVTNLLKERHYKWVSRRAEIEALLDNALPELTISDRESYETSFNSIHKAGFDTSLVGV